MGDSSNASRFWGDHLLPRSSARAACGASVVLFGRTQVLQQRSPTNPRDMNTDIGYRLRES